MKQLFFLLLIIVSMISCSPDYQDSYSISEMKTLISIGKAIETTDSIEVSDDYGNLTKFPIIQLDENYGAYPSLSVDSGIRYYVVTQD